MALAEADDFFMESKALADTLNGQSAIFSRPTLFKNWTVDDVLVHLHFWNGLVDLSLTDTERFRQEIAATLQGMVGRGLRAYENDMVTPRGPALAAAWIERVEAMMPRWRTVDPKARLEWVGPSMSARSSMTARQMETWAHGRAVFDLLGLERRDTDRIRNIVVLGVNTFGWSHQVQGLDVPPAMPEVRLTAPSGAVWTFGAPEAGSIVGPASDFAAVVTQTRNVADTALVVDGEVAKRWMTHAQCFAGPRETPPAVGARVKNAVPPR